MVCPASLLFDSPLCGACTASRWCSPGLPSKHDTRGSVLQIPAVGVLLPVACSGFLGCDPSCFAFFLFLIGRKLTPRTISENSSRRALVQTPISQRQYASRARKVEHHACRVPHRRVCRTLGLADEIAIISGTHVHPSFRNSSPELPISLIHPATRPEALRPWNTARSHAYYFHTHAGLAVNIIDVGVVRVYVTTKSSR